MTAVSYPLNRSSQLTHASPQQTPERVERSGEAPAGQLRAVDNVAPNTDSRLEKLWSVPYNNPRPYTGGETSLTKALLEAARQVFGDAYYVGELEGPGAVRLMADDYRVPGPYHEVVVSVAGDELSIATPSRLFVAKLAVDAASATVDPKAAAASLKQAWQELDDRFHGVRRLHEVLKDCDGGPDDPIVSALRQMLPSATLTLEESERSSLTRRYQAVDAAGRPLLAVGFVRRYDLEQSQEVVAARISGGEQLGFVQRLKPLTVDDTFGLETVVRAIRAGVSDLVNADDPAA